MRQKKRTSSNGSRPVNYPHQPPDSSLNPLEENRRQPVLKSSIIVFIAVKASK